MSLITLYHGTSMTRLKNMVRTNRLSPQARKGIGEISIEEKNLYYGFVFFATDSRVSLDYAFYTNSIEEQPDTQLPVLVFEIPEELLLPDDNDSYGCTTWEESAARIKQVKVKGHISLDFLSHVEVYQKPDNLCFFQRKLLFTKTKGDFVF